jgi:GT2 family glycosyltransferase
LTKTLRDTTPVEGQPLVTVSVLSYLRPEALERVLDSLFTQAYPNLEVIVVDNGSGAELTGAIRRQFPQVNLIELPENVGTSARNRGIEAARGEIIVTLDNDVYFDDRFAIQRIVGAFRRHPQAGCVAFRVYHPQTGRLHVRDWCHPRPWQTSEGEEFETHYITEGAAAFRREMFNQVEPYWPLLFIGHEGFDLGVRLLDAGYEIWYLPEIRVWHMASLETRQDWRLFYFYSRNLLPVVWRNYPWGAGLRFLAPRLGVLAWYAFQGGAFRHYLRGFLDGLAMLPQCRRLRRAVRVATLRKVAELKRFQPTGITRFLLARERLTPLLRSPSCPAPAAQARSASRTHK